MMGKQVHTNLYMCLVHNLVECCCNMGLNLATFVTLLTQIQIQIQNVYWQRLYIDNTSETRTINQLTYSNITIYTIYMHMKYSQTNCVRWQKILHPCSTGNTSTSAPEANVLLIPRQQRCNILCDRPAFFFLFLSSGRKCFALAVPLVLPRVRGYMMQCHLIHNHV